MACGSETVVSGGDAMAVDAAGDAANETGAGDGGGVGRNGCANGSVKCASPLQCCAGGVPYPPEGICAQSCNLDSDRAIKHGFTEVDRDAILRKLASLHVEGWSYRTEPGVRHVGPMSQEFSAAFGLGNSDRVINAVDANGVTIAAIQALLRRVEALESETRNLRRDNAQLRRTERK